MDPKPRPDHRLPVQIVRWMMPEQHLRKAFELSAITWPLFGEGLRQGYPNRSEEKFHKRFLERLAFCHNRTF